MSANKLLVADAAAFCAKPRHIRSRKRNRQAGGGNQKNPYGPPPATVAQIATIHSFWRNDVFGSEAVMIVSMIVRDGFTLINFQTAPVNLPAITLHHLWTPDIHRVGRRQDVGQCDERVVGLIGVPPMENFRVGIGFARP